MSQDTHDRAPALLDRQGQAALPPSLAEHVSRILREDILNGRFRPGDRLTEEAVRERTGVSRTPAREGLRRLEAEGLVVSRRGRGSHVAYRLSAEEALLVYDCRIALEPSLTAMAAERATAEDRAGIAAVLRQFVTAIDGDPRTAGQLDADFHMAIYEASGSELIGVLRGYWTRLQLELSARVYTTELPRRFVREHVEIADAIEHRDPELAATRMRDHIAHGREALVRALRPAPDEGRAAAAPGGEPLQDPGARRA